MTAVAIFHADHTAHLTETLTAHAAGVPVFLGNPHWSEEELAEAARQIPHGTTVQGRLLEPRGQGAGDWPHAWSHRLMIPTGGTGGKVKFIVHDRATLRAAAQGLRTVLGRRGLSPILHGLSCTPPWHVSGLMPAIRARETGGTYQVSSGRFAADESLPLITLPAGGTRLASFVPAQLLRLLRHPEGAAWLRQFEVILLGGSSVPTELRTIIRERRLPVFVTYGMTETAALCALCPPEDVWSEAPLRGHPLPGTEFSAHEGILSVASPALGLGLWPDQPIGRPFLTGDRGTVAPDGSVHVSGRADRMIITGGEKVDPTRVEQALCAQGGVTEVHVFGLPDPQWGECVAACVVRAHGDEAMLRQAAQSLEPAARPKRYVFVSALPLDARGKIDRAALRQLFV